MGGELDEGVNGNINGGMEEHNGCRDRWRDGSTVG